MITGERKDYQFFGTMKQMFETPENSLGEVFVKHLEPINLKEYLAKTVGTSTINSDNFETAAL